MSHLSIRHFAYRAAGRKGAYKSGAISNRRTDNFAKTRQLIDEPPPFKRAGIDTIGYEDKSRISAATTTYLVDDFQRRDRRLKVKPGRRAWHNDQTGDRDRCAQSPLTGGGVNDGVAIVLGDAVELADPIKNGLIGKHNLMHRKLQIAGRGPLAGRTLRISVDQSDQFSTFVKLCGNGNRYGGLAHATFSLRHYDNVMHRLSARCFSRQMA